MFEEDGEVDEVADSGVLATSEVAEHAVEFLCCVPVDVDRFDVGCWDTCEGHGVGYGEFVGGVKFMDSGGHVELDPPEGFVGQLRADFGAPGRESCAVIA